jgi:hypothetical protein
MRNVWGEHSLFVNSDFKGFGVKWMTKISKLGIMSMGSKILITLQTIFGIFNKSHNDNKWLMEEMNAIELPSFPPWSQHEDIQSERRIVIFQARIIAQ